MNNKVRGFTSLGVESPCYLCRHLKPLRCFSSEIISKLNMVVSSQMSSEEWIPNALENWDSIESMLRGKNLALFLDYDGTLTPIVSRPEMAVISDSNRQLVKDISNRFSTSIVTGRNMSTIKNFLKLDGKLNFAASHGFDIQIHPMHKSNSEPVTDEIISKQVGQEYLPYLKEAYDMIHQRIADFEGATVENNIFSLSIHYRNCKPERFDEIVSQLESFIDEIVYNRFSGNLKKTKGKKVFEIRPMVEWHKGKAVSYLLNLMTSQEQFTKEEICPIFIGDDVTDEDAFHALQVSFGSENSVRILVSPYRRETAANFWVKSTEEVSALLQKILNYNS